MVYHGNRHLTHLDPQYFDYDLSLDSIWLNVDGQDQNVSFGDIVNVKKTFSVTKLDSHRVNVIGFKKPDLKNESGVIIRKKDIQKRFSIDKAGNIYRVEVYNGTRFSGMVLVDFGIKKKTGLDLAMQQTRHEDLLSLKHINTTENGR